MKQKNPRGRQIFSRDAGGIGNMKHRTKGTVCYETEKPSRRADIFERGSLVEPNVLCGCVRDRGTGEAHG